MDTYLIILLGVLKVSNVHVRNVVIIHLRLALSTATEAAAEATAAEVTASHKAAHSEQSLEPRGSSGFIPS